VALRQGSTRTRLCESAAAALRNGVPQRPRARARSQRHPGSGDSRPPS